MFSYIFHTFFYNPLYNLLVLLIDVLPGADVGLAVVVLTIIVKFVLFPLSQKALKTQVKLKVVQKEIDEIKKQYKEDQKKLAEETLNVYRKHNINPFAGFATLLIQIPLVFALYFIFAKGGLPSINTSILYSFISVPEMANMHFLGFFNVAEKSIVAAILVGITQFFQAKLSLGNQTLINKESKPFGQNDFKEDFVKGLHLQMKYVLPVVMVLVSANLIAVVPLYWIVGNLFMIGQEIYLRKHKEALNN